MAADCRRTLLVRIFDQLTGAERRVDVRPRARYIAVERRNAGDQKKGEDDGASQHRTAGGRNEPFRSHSRHFHRRQPAQRSPQCMRLAEPAKQPVGKSNTARGLRRIRLEALGV